MFTPEELLLLGDAKFFQGATQPTKGFLDEGAALAFAFHAENAAITAIAQQTQYFPYILRIDAVPDRAVMPVSLPRAASARLSETSLIWT